LAESSGARRGGEVLFAWPAAGHPLQAIPVAKHSVDVADSWLVDQGMVRGLPYHAERFIESCRRRHGVAALVTAEFLDAVAAALPLTGRWFPRVEFEAGEGFRLRLRVAPPPSAAVVLRHADKPDSRRDPTVKGPDLAMLVGMRQEAAALGADEVLLVGMSGTVLEGALSAILWWRGDVLCAPPLSLPVLPSVTRRLLLEIAADISAEVRFEACAARDLDGLELWTASALHGIRPVTSWSGGGLTAAPARRAVAWQARLIAKAIRIPGPIQAGQYRSASPVLTLGEQG
jgi:branched-subunit amino acid aminotransferase/4-amino-4-deoxychorismate lyase